MSLILFLNIMSQRSFLYHLIPLPGSSNNVQYRTERIKIPSTPRYPRSMLGSDRGTALTRHTGIRIIKSTWGQTANQPLWVRPSFSSRDPQVLLFSGSLSCKMKVLNRGLTAPAEEKQMPHWYWVSGVDISFKHLNLAVWVYRGLKSLVTTKLWNILMCILIGQIVFRQKKNVSRCK